MCDPDNNSTLEVSLEKENNADNPTPPRELGKDLSEVEKLFSNENCEDVEIKKTTGCCSKYGNALKTCIPWRPKQKDKTKLPSNSAGLLSYMSVSWLTGLMWKAYRKGLEKEDLWQLQSEDAAALSCNRLERLWECERRNAKKKNTDPVFWRVAWASIKTRVFISIILSLFVNFLQFIGPSVFLKLILDYINDFQVDQIYGAYLLLGFFTVNIARGACFNLMIVISSHTAIRLTGGVQSMVYRKILKLKIGSEKLSAQITNILTSDMERLFESVVSSVFLTASPALFLFTTVYSIYVIGPWALVGLTCYLLLYPVMGAIAKAQSRVRLNTVKQTDKRVGLMTEILNSMKLIKMYAWEESFSEKIADIREGELKKHRIGGLLQAVASTTVPSISILATICTLLGYTLSGYSLKSSEAFTIFSMFNAMQFTAGVLPYTIRSIAEAKIALARIQRLLDLPEHRKELCGLINNTLAISIKNATFAYEMHSIDAKSKLPNPEEPKNMKTKNKKSKTINEETEIPLKDSIEEAKNTAENLLPGADKVSPSIEESQKKSLDATKLDVEISEILFGINLSIQTGSLVGICGSVGSGKSSLISAINGDMNASRGVIQVNGRLAYVSQQAFIYNSSLRDNVTFGCPYDEKWFNDVVDACSLLPDIKKMPNGILTEIGEKGINLSGGQKQRVNLARAVYSNRDIYLLDDPLSAVDAKVANNLFIDCIKGKLMGKTVILVTHSTQFLEACDHVLLMEGGKICERGTHKDLMQRKGQYFNMFNLTSSNGSPNASSVGLATRELKRKESLLDKSRPIDVIKSDDGKLIQEETKEVGSVSAEVYFKFMKVCGGWLPCSLVFFVTLLFTLSRLFNIVWLQRWLDAGDGLEDLRLENQTLYNITLSDDQLKGSITENDQLWLYQVVYALSFLFLIITGIFKGIGITFSVLRGASKLHQDMFNSILMSPMSFIETTPIGRILNRFSRDMDEVDIRIPFFMEFVLQGMLSIIGQIILACVIFPIFLLPLLFIAVLFVWVDHILNAGVRELKRLDNNSKSPVIQHLGASVAGLGVIRAFDKESHFIARFNEFLNEHSAAMFIFRLSSRWFSYRMDLMATMVTTTITIICIFTKGQISTALAGLALASVNGVCSFTPFFMRMKSELMSRITSVERILQYAYNIKSEAPRKIEGAKLPSPWPSTGKIELQKVSLRYRPELSLVLHEITASINPAEKIGIVGRTGAGKSSMIVSLMRLVELESGSIVIDGVDVSTLGLHTLRSAISVIPQDPVLFQGSVRYNLDPFNNYKDDEIWEALDQAHLNKKISGLSLKLESAVEASGENFSVGEKQLICLARALLRKNKILLLDEATASVDLETDHFIQQTLQSAFEHCTVLTIAHRLNTIANYDRILVLDGGRVKEFDSPSKLMETDGSLFKEMMASVGVRKWEELLKENPNA